VSLALPPGYDRGALIEELERLQLFTIEHRDFILPAEIAAPKPAKVELVTIRAKVSVELVDIAQDPFMAPSTERR
jgi:hypothetical protein